MTPGRCILGVDPGLSGAIALFDPTDADLQIVDMPLVVNNGKKSKLDLYKLGMQIDAWKHYIQLAVVENVHSMPQQGVASTFTFGRAFGSVEGVIASCMIPMEHVAPNVWKPRMGVTADKQTSRDRATQILPAHAKLWALKKHDGRAEAALLALYGAAVDLESLLAASLR